MRASTTAALKTALRKRQSAREQRMREKIGKSLAAGGPGRKYEKAACFVPESLSSTSLLHGQRKAEFFLAKFGFRVRLLQGSPAKHFWRAAID